MPDAGVHCWCFRGPAQTGINTARVCLFGPIRKSLPDRQQCRQPVVRQRPERLNSLCDRGIQFQQAVGCDFDFFSRNSHDMTASGIFAIVQSSMTAALHNF